MTRLLCLVLFGCHHHAAVEPAQLDPTSWTSEERDGERVFHRVCHRCHPFGGGGLGVSLSDEPLPGALVRLQVRAGLGAMPAVHREQLSPAELDAVLAYLKALRQSRPRR